MDPAIGRSLNDKLYDKRKMGALELEKLIREHLANNDTDKIKEIIDQLVHDFAYAIHQPHARNGGLIGLAAASIALGPEVAYYLDSIIPPVLACFEDQDARVRYYACESMYNIAKVAKGEVLLNFNEIFDALCKLTADTELSVKNGAELLDRLIKDIVAESASTYISILHTSQDEAVGSDEEENDSDSILPTAFSLKKFIPLLQERIHVINPFTRQFLVSWIVLLDGIPDLELVTFLPEFLGDLFGYLADHNADVHDATEVCLEGFLQEIRKIAFIKRGVQSRRGTISKPVKPKSPSVSEGAVTDDTDTKKEDDDTRPDDQDSGLDGMWMPGQDIPVDHKRILEILMTFIDPSSQEEELQRTGFLWVASFLEICPEEVVQFIPRLLSYVLPATSSNFESVREVAHKVDGLMLNLILNLFGDSKLSAITSHHRQSPIPPNSHSHQDPRSSTPMLAEQTDEAVGEDATRASLSSTTGELDYGATVHALTIQFLNENEATRLAALDWLIMLHKKAGDKVIAVNDGTFPALLKTLSDPSELVVTKDLELLSQISRNSDDDVFASFMNDLLNLFSTDRRLLETRGYLIIRRLCLNLNPERIYRTLAEIIEKEEDVEFASTMVQLLNNNLMTAPEIGELRKRLRSLDTKDGQTLFIALFRSWCHNAVAAFCLCLLAQAYEQASNLLAIFGELELSVSLLIQLDKLVQLLESPVFTYLRMQLLEPEKYPFLYKCLYGLLMLMPQSTAFAALKNRLNSVSAIGYLHQLTPRTAPTSTTSSYEPRNRLKARSENEIKWIELLEKFKNVQEKARRYNVQYITKAPTLPPLTDVPPANGVSSSGPHISGHGTSPSGPPNRIPTPGSVTGAPTNKPKGGLGIARLARGRIKTAK
ncbi:hypothetical protein TWF106_004323 [Orbilia oligospora]|uniref:Vacuolar protein 14 C-terminal Fig4-binding domain-containing protein n=1 Tax=Orbilia oligospora TaxID=2813651 RepID=A0A6G1MQH6_ORBOL|nr:hypothetical protein TWF788_003286 [Orbilia oligospora]KAF3216254.1 hypothetical protein TWF191_009083 [Orbilia oligospora]KAF3216830.1 hypothetical protein TWF679_002671 [Orbilia oligospora]KAF3229406.1 hypothetical protein TWF106_004323 [Orbilia oligospora]KAF3264438.1 hypothetical protein TWF192_004120 [Orbilia oligospora]